MHIAIPSFNIKMFLFTDSLFPFLLIHQAVFMLLFSDQNQMSLLKYKIPTYMILFNIFFSIVQYLLEDSLYFSVIPVMGFQPLSSLHLFFFFFFASSLTKNASTSQFYNLLHSYKNLLQTSTIFSITSKNGSA